MKILWLGFWSLGLAALAPACSSSSSAPTPGAGAADFTQACTDTATATCNKLDSCRFQGATRAYGTVQACIDRTRQACLTSSSAPGTGATPAGREACAKATSDASCADYNAPAPLAACQAQAGSGAAGAGCAYGAQCQSGYCAVPSTASCGTCAAVPAAGSDCLATLNCGATGLRCKPNDRAMPTMATCEQPGTAGGACDTQADCASGYDCIGARPAKMTQGACTATAATMGAACDATAGPNCAREAGLTCDPTMKTCVPITLAASGATCGFAMGAYTDCQPGAACVLAVGSKGVGICMPYAGTGAACDTNSGPYCLSPDRCVLSAASGTAGTCAPPDPTKCP